MQNSPGAEFHGDLHVPLDALVVDKATTPDAEAFSAFDGTGLEDELRRRGILRVFVAGLATDYCVKHTALDAVRTGFATVCVEDGVRAVADATGEAAISEMKEAGVIFCQSGNLE